MSRHDAEPIGFLNQDLNEAVERTPVYNGFVKHWRHNRRNSMVGRVDFHRSVNERNIHQFFRKPELLIEFDESDSSLRPSLELIGEDGKTTGITRYYLKVKVSNHGDVMASRCRAKLKVIEKSSSRSPSDAKFLCWDIEPNRFIDIGAHDDELLHIVFTDSNFESNHKNGGLDIYALASTVESLHDEEKFIKQARKAI